jgi:uncharacterized protein YceK
MRKPIVLIAAAALLAGCGASTSSTAPSPAVSSASTTGQAPTAQQIAWAGGVCTATTALKKNVEALASAVTSGGNRVTAALQAQMVTVETSATTLVTAITTLPAGSESDPKAAAVKTSADQLKASITSLESSVTALQGKSGISQATALASVGAAAVDALSKFGATAAAIKNAAQDGNSTLGRALAAAPSCSSLTS